MSSNINSFYKTALLESSIGIRNHTQEDKIEILRSIFSLTKQVVRIYDMPNPNSDIYDVRLFIRIADFLNEGKKIQILFDSEFSCETSEIPRGYKVLYNAKKHFENLEIKVASTEFAPYLRQIDPTIMDFVIGDNKYVRYSKAQEKAEAYFSSNPNTDKVNSILDLFDEEYNLYSENWKPI